MRAYPEGKAALSAYAGSLDALRGLNGERRPFADVVSALRADAEPLQPPASPPANVKPLVPVPRSLSVVGADGAPPGNAKSNRPYFQAEYKPNPA